MLKRMISLSATVCMGLFSVLDAVASLSMDNSILSPFNSDETDKWHRPKRRKRLKTFAN